MNISKNTEKTTTKTKIATMTVIMMLIISTLVLITSITVQASLAPEQPYSGPIKSGDVADGIFDSDVWISITCADQRMGYTSIQCSTKATRISYNNN